MIFSSYLWVRHIYGHFKYNINLSVAVFFNGHLHGIFVSLGFNLVFISSRKKLI